MRQLKEKTSTQCIYPHPSIAPQFQVGSSILDHVIMQQKNDTGSFPILVLFELSHFLCMVLQLFIFNGNNKKLQRRSLTVISRRVINILTSQEYMSRAPAVKVLQKILKEGTFIRFIRMFPTRVQKVTHFTVIQFLVKHQAPSDSFHQKINISWMTGGKV